MPGSSLHLDLPDAAATDQLGGALARSFPGAAAHGASVHLGGELGVGKTACVRGLLRSLGVFGRIRSPTYSLIETYVLAPLTVVHVDLYRLRSPDELDDLGLREQFVAGSLMLIEWPARAGAALPPADLDIALAYQGGGRRAELTFSSALGSTWRENLLRDSSLTPYLPN